MHSTIEQRRLATGALGHGGFRPLRTIAAAVLSAVALAGGCGRGSSLAEATGTVTYRGNPVPNANVVLQPQEGPPALGISDGQGRFSLATGGRPGTAPGPATVAVTAYDDVRTIPPGDQDPEGVSEVRSRIPQRYALVATSPLKVEVSASGSNHFDLELTDP